MIKNIHRSTVVLLFSIITFVTLPMVAYSYSSKSSNSSADRCEYLNIQITNMTGSVCYLKNATETSGRAILPAPASILPGDTKFFQMQQIWDNKITTTYNCGGKSIVMQSKQSTCQLSKGRVSAKVVSHDAGIYADYSLKDSSSWSDSPGSLNWRIKSSTGQ